MLNDVSVSPALAILAVFVGGVLGGLGRWALACALPERVGTWAANMVGCAILGYAATMSEVWQVAAGADLAGALTTWSTLAKELGELIKTKQWGEVARYGLGTALIGIAFVVFGMRWGLRGGFV